MNERASYTCKYCRESQILSTNKTTYKNIPFTIKMSKLWLLSLSWRKKCTEHCMQLKICTTTRKILETRNRWQTHRRLCKTSKNRRRDKREKRLCNVKHTAHQVSQVWITQFYLPTTQHLPLPVVRQGAPRLNEQLQHQLMKLNTH